MAESKRDNKEIYQKEKDIYKMYTVRIQKDIANIFDDKLKADGETFTTWTKKQIEKYFKKK